MFAPVKPPWRTSNGAIDTCTCSTASNGTGSALVCPPGAGSSRPNGLLKYDPSREMLLYSQLPREGDVPVASRIEPGEVARAPLDRRQRDDELRRYGCRRAGAPGVEGAVTIRRHLHSQRS